MSSHLFRTNETSGVYYLPPARWLAIESTATKEKVRLLKAELPPRVATERRLAQLGADLDFPIWYGSNFDALFDCLTDPDWQPAKAHLLMIKGMAELRTANPDDFSTLIDVLGAAAEARKAAQSPFWILLDTPARGIPTFIEA